MTAPVVDAVDPFDLPEALGAEQVTWTAGVSVDGRPLVRGAFTPADGEQVGCDLLAGDLAYPVAVLGDSWRHDAHQAWTLGQVLLVRYEGRLTLVVPGTTVTLDLLVEALRRFAKAVGADPERYVVAVRL